MVKLFCAVDGVVFDVDIDKGASVSALKKAIKDQSDGLITAPWMKLQLFLAKKDGNWLNGDDVAAVTLDEAADSAVPVLVDDRGNRHDFVKMDPSLWIKNPKLFGSNFQPEEGQVHVLVVVPGGASTSENKRKRKRMEDKEFPDAWMKAIKDEQVTALPLTCDDLKKHLQRELRVKVPIDDTLFQMVSAPNLSGEFTSIFNKLFEAEPRGKLSHRTATIVGSVVEPIMACSENATEETYHHLWDSLIVGLLMRVSTGNYRRNTNASTSTGPYRPDLCFYGMNSNVCVFRGEEKASGELDVPVKELHEKLTWRYDDAPYVFGYAAVGLLVCLVAIRKDEKTGSGAKAEQIETYNLGGLKGRLSFFLALLNLSTLFRPVVDLIQPLGIPEYTTIRRSNGVQIEFAEDCVVKTYPQSMPSDDIIRNLRELHRLMKKHSVPNVVELKKTNMKEKYVRLTPIGLLSPPENAQQLLMALRDILKALVALHAINLMHRDLRWENVLKYSDEGDKWFLIDFDEGTSSPAAKVTHLKAESHAPEILSSSSHTVKVDIWSVGYLLMTSPFQDLPPELERIKSQCLQKNPSSRPTAKSLLTAIESLIES